MDKIANLRANERRELFQETAAHKGIHPAVVEKGLLGLLGTQAHL